jgi:SAM-dependent methyltransferase
VSRHFADGGADYARYRPTYPRELAAALAGLAPAGALAVDVGCGTGQLSRLLAAAGLEVLGVDASPGQLAHAERRPGVRFVAGSAEALPVRERVAGLVVAAQAAHWFALRPFWAEVRRVVVADGAVALVTYGTPELDEAVDAVFRRFYADVIGPWWPPERRHVETGYAAFDFPFTPLALPALAIEREWPCAAFLGYVATFSAVKAARRAGAGAAIDAFADDVRRAWGDPGRPRRVRWPLTVRAGRV